MDELEFLFNNLIKSTEIVKEEFNLNFLEAIIKNIEFFFAETNDKILSDIYAKIKEKEYSVKIIRQAMQYLFMKGFKEDLKPIQITPDNIGFLIVFLIKKFFSKNDKLKIIDPLVGTGNLLSIVLNELEENLIYAVGVDNDYISIKLAEANFMMQDLKVSLTYQNILTYNSSFKFNLMISDVPSFSIDGKYFPYHLLLSLVDKIEEKGKIFFLIEEDFFQKDEENKKKILEKFKVLGLITLPDDLFLNRKKVILVLEKNEQANNKKAFICEINSFTDIVSFNQSITKINEWFMKGKKEK